MALMHINYTEQHNIKFYISLWHKTGNVNQRTNKRQYKQ